MLGMKPTSIGDVLALLCGPDFGDISYRELDRLAQKTPGHAQAIASGTILDPRSSTLAAYERVLGARLDPNSALPSPDDVVAAIARARETRPVGADHTASDFTPDNAVGPEAA
jgi:hypothetical protein